MKGLLTLYRAVQMPVPHTRLDKPLPLCNALESKSLGVQQKQEIEHCWLCAQEPHRVDLLRPGGLEMQQKRVMARQPDTTLNPKKG